MPGVRGAEEMLLDAFDPKHIKAAVRHFSEMVDEFRLRKWEKSIAKGGKFIEAILKALWVKAGEVVPAGKLFKADTTINQLPQRTVLADDSLRLTIPRSCRVIYDIASNRGGRHDPGEVDPNEMDANVVLSNAQWIIAELVRYSQKGGAAPDQAAARVAELTKRRYPLFEEIDGRLYSDVGESARDVGLMLLFFHGRRLSSKELVASIQRHGHKLANAKMAVARLRNVIDDDGNGSLKLRMNGIREAEALLEHARGAAQ